MQFNNRLLLTSFAVSVGLYLSAEAKQWDIAAPGGVGDVTALTNAFAKCANNDVISLAEGLYDLSDVSMKSTAKTSHLAIGVKTGVTVRGAEGTKREKVILKGGGATSKLRLLSCDRAVNFRGLTLTGGHLESDQGAVYCSDGSSASSPRSTAFYDCIFSNNYSKTSGVLYLANTVSNCLFVANAVSTKMVQLSFVTSWARDCQFACNTGATITVGTTGNYSGCTFVSNIATQAEGKSNQIGCILSSVGAVVGCTFEGNDIKTTSGELKFVGLAYGVGAYTNCIFRGNRSQVGVVGQKVGSVYGCQVVSNICQGGGLLKTYDKVACRVARCTFVGNRASGRLIYDTDKKYTLDNCLFVDNVTTNGGVGATIANGVTVRNCTVVGQVNRETQVFGPDSVLVNTLIYGSYAHSVSQAASPLMTNCVWDTQNSSKPVPTAKAVNCIWLNGRSPCFVDPEHGDYTLLRRSPARDAGWSDAAYLSEIGPVDLAGNPRVYAGDGDAAVDVGAYECCLRAPGLMMLVR